MGFQGSNGPLQSRQVFNLVELILSQGVGKQEFKVFKPSNKSSSQYKKKLGKIQRCLKRFTS